MPGQCLAAEVATGAVGNGRASRSLGCVISTGSRIGQLSVYQWRHILNDNW
jgi:hypothetical protein